MQSLLTDDDAEKARKALLEGLEATKWVRVGPGAWEAVPDYQVRSAVGAKILEWKIGKPVETVRTETTQQLEAHLTPADLGRMLADNRALAGEILDSIIQSAKTVQPIEVPQLKQENEAKPLSSDQ